MGRLFDDVKPRTEVKIGDIVRCVRITDKDNNFVYATISRGVEYRVIGIKEVMGCVKYVLTEYSGSKPRDNFYYDARAFELVGGDNG